MIYNTHAIRHFARCLGVSLQGLLLQGLLLSSLVLTSCSEKLEAGEWDNWQARNQHYVDSIARLADSGVDGWKRLCAFNINDSVEALKPNNNHYVYYKVLETGEGAYNPQFRDSIRVHYMGRLIPTVTYPQGMVFGKSYSTYTLNEATDVPALMAVNENVVGFATASLHMVEGDRWQLVIPYYLGYGTTKPSQADIPGYSALIFDAKVARVYPYKSGANTTWH